ncbi:hypothetical protein [Priestia megaterium]|uniref:hypothetical protein n=1 Tax=Priestia megaterium TaxID=1404 RepID=UPI0024528306|nr:hypothetical protein [Priestia megaterium]MDH3183723.1 hypothetical protein [Priestia megaterium]
MALSSTARTQLLQRLLDLSQNVTNTTTSSLGNVSVDLGNLGGIDLTLPNLRSLLCPSSPPSTPTDMSSYLSTLLNKQVEILTPGGPNTGTLAAVKTDYIALIGSTGTTTLIPMSSIEGVREI